jgi:hypothetical protein
LIRNLLRAVAFVACALPLLAAAPAWTPIGPDDRISALVVDPQDSGHLLVGAESGTTRLGVLGTDDGGAHWTPRNQGLPATTPLPAIYTLAADPGGDNVFYAGTEAGLFKSLDGGTSWTRLGGHGTGLALDVVFDLEVAPTRPATVYAAGYRREPCSQPFCGFTYVYAAYRSTTGGAHWKALPADGWPQRIALAPSRPATAYLASRHLWRTTDGSRSWSQRTLPPGRIIDLTVDPGSPGGSGRSRERPTRRASIAASTPERPGLRPTPVYPVLSAICATSWPCRARSWSRRATAST